MILKVFTLICVSLLSIQAEYVSYKNYRVYKVTPTTEKHVNVLNEILKQHEYMLWLEGVVMGRGNMVMVAPEKLYKFEKLMADEGIEASLMIDDVQEAVENQTRKPITRINNEYAFERFLDLGEINEWMDKMAAEYSSVAQMNTIGITAEGREIREMVINYKPNKERPVIGIVEGTLHAREWISPVTCLWMIKEFLTSTDPGVRAMAEDVQWHILPVTNPDGYVYSFTDNRMWRKNRNPLNRTTCQFVDDDMSVGVDLNRNFDFMWMHIGASANPCDITYAGPRPFSEAESLALSQHILALGQQGQLMYYLSFHSWSEILLVPYSHVGGSNVLEVPNYADLYEIGIRAMDKLRVRYNTSYEVGTSMDILYPVGGGGFDWAKAGGNIPIVFLYELRDKGRYGFLLPPDQIIPNNEEVMDSLIEMDKVVRALGYYTSAAHNICLNIILLAAGLFCTFLSVY